MKIKTLIKFSGVPEGTTGEAERDKDEWKITWDLPFKLYGIKQKRLQYRFDDMEFKKYLVVIK